MHTRHYANALNILGKQVVIKIDEQRKIIEE